MKISSSAGAALLVIVIGSGVAWHLHVNQQSALLVPLDIPDLRPLLNQERFSQLTEEMEELQKDYEVDYTREDYLFEAIKKVLPKDGGFVTEDPDFTATLDKWEHESEQSHIPYVVQCRYFYNVGFERRGLEWAKDTTAQQFEEMRHFLDLSDKKCEVALSKNPKSSIAYATMIASAKGTSGRERKLSILRRARENLESSYRVDLAFLESLEPRWGGSEQAMEVFVDRATRDRPNDVFSLRLKGRLRYLKAIPRFEQGEHHLALRYMDEAIDLYPSRKHLSYRAWVLGNLGEYEAAIEDLRAVLNRYPRAEWENQYLARTLRSTGQYSEAVQRWDELIEWHDDKAMVFQQRAYALWDLDEYEKAEGSLLKSLEIDPDNKYTWTGLGRLYSYELKEIEKAELAFEHAIGIDPDNPVPYYEAGALFYWAADKRANEYLKKYLEVCALVGDCKKDHIHFAEEFFECLEPDSGCDWEEVDKEHFL